MAMLIGFVIRFQRDLEADFFSLPFLRWLGRGLGLAGAVGAARILRGAWGMVGP